MNAPAAGVGEGEGEGGHRRVLSQDAEDLAGKADRIHSGVGTVCSCPLPKGTAAGHEAGIIEEMRHLGRRPTA